MPDPTYTFTDAPLSRSWGQAGKDAAGTVWNWLSSPLTTAPSDAARAVSHWIDPEDPIRGRSTGGWRGASSAFIESLGDAASGLTSVANLGLTALTGGVGGAVGRNIARGAGAVQAVHGLHEMGSGDTRSQGIADAIMGALATIPGGRSTAGKVAPTESTARLLYGKERFTPPGGDIDALDWRFGQGRLRTPNSYADEPSPYVGRGQASGAGTDPLDPRFTGRERMPSSYQDEPSLFVRGYEPTAAKPVDPLDPRFTGRERMPASYADEPLPASPYTRFEPSGGTVDPLDPRFSSRPQATTSAEYARDPFASDLDTAVQPDLSILHSTPVPAPAEFAESVPKPHSDPSARAVDTVTAPEPHTYDLGDLDLQSEPAQAPIPTDPTDIIRGFLGGGETPGAATPGRPKPRIPAPITSLWQRLRPAWTDSLARQAGDEIPFTVDPREDLVPFAQRVASDDPSVLMGKERAVRRDLTDEQRRGILGDEQGYIDPELFTAPAEGLNKLRYFSMLSSPATQAKNVLGNVGAVISHAAEHPRDAGTILREFFNSQTVRDAIREYRESAVGPEGRWGSEQGALGIPGRIMGAIDRGTKDALSRAGVPSDLAEEITFTNRPKSVAGQNFTDFLNRTPLAKLAVPFSRTATNILERGLERTPGVGYLAQRLSGGNLQTSAAKQILGAIALAGGTAAGSNNPYVEALLAPYSVPFALGAGMRTAYGKRHSTGADVANAAVHELFRMAPLPDEYTLSPSQWLASYVPNIVRDINPMIGIDPSRFDTSHSLTGRAVAKVPILNELLLHKKARAPRARPAR